MLDQAEISNFVLKSLSDTTFARVAPLLQPIELSQHFKMSGSSRTQEWVYFPDTGIASVVFSKNGMIQEAGMFGREGASSIFSPLVKSKSSISLVMQVAGSGNRIQAKHLIELTSQLEDLRTLLTELTLNSLYQIMQTAMANTQLNMSQRLARWLLMIMDRMKTDKIRITHEYLSFMLGVSRPSVTTSLLDLSDRGFIVNRRAFIEIKEPVGLMLMTRDLVTGIDDFFIPGLISAVQSASLYRQKITPNDTLSVRRSIRYS